MSLYEELKKRNLTFVSNPSRGASYIMEDGKFLDLNSNKLIIFLQIEDYESAKATHPVFDAYCERIGLVSKRYQKTLVETDNAIAINDGTNFSAEAAYLVLPEQEPTNAQYDSLLQWLDSILAKTNEVQIEDNMKHRLYLYDIVSLENDNGYTPEQIIQDVKRMYNERRKNL